MYRRANSGAAYRGRVTYSSKNDRHRIPQFKQGSFPSWLGYESLLRCGISVFCISEIRVLISFPVKLFYCTSRYIVYIFRYTINVGSSGTQAIGEYYTGVHGGDTGIQVCVPDLVLFININEFKGFHKQDRLKKTACLLWLWN